MYSFGRSAATDTFIKRRRKCLNCNNRWSTIEKPVEILAEEGEMNCVGCAWRGRYQKCNCCKRNPRLDDRYEKECP